MFIMKTEANSNEVSFLIQEIKDIKSILQELKHNPPIAPEWIPRSRVKEFFNYGETQMASLEKTENLVMTKVGHRKFFHRDSIIGLLNKNTLK